MVRVSCSWMNLSHGDELGVGGLRSHSEMGKPFIVFFYYTIKNTDI